MLPYLLSILALVVMARRAAYPQALMKPYRKGERWGVGPRSAARFPRGVATDRQSRLRATPMGDASFMRRR